jgi:dipeptidyl aminopeptidase/acylaminoacyl peptidase
MPYDSNIDPSFNLQHTLPCALTSTGAASGIQSLSHHRLLFSSSSLQGPNDVFLLHSLDTLDLFSQNLTDEGVHVALVNVQEEQITHFTENALEGKDLGLPEQFYFEGAEGKRIHGYIIKPKGWDEHDPKASWPVALLIHGGVSEALLGGSKWMKELMC